MYLIPRVCCSYHYMKYEFGWLSSHSICVWSWKILPFLCVLRVGVFISDDVLLLLVLLLLLLMLLYLMLKQARVVTTFTYGYQSSWWVAAYKYINTSFVGEQRFSNRIFSFINTHFTKLNNIYWISVFVNRCWMYFVISYYYSCVFLCICFDLFVYCWELKLLHTYIQYKYNIQQKQSQIIVYKVIKLYLYKVMATKIK